MIRVLGALTTISIVALATMFLTGSGPFSRPGGPAAAAPAAAPATPAQAASSAPPTGASAAPNSRWMGNATVPANDTAPLPTGVAAHGNMDVTVPAGTMAIVEAYEIGDWNGVNKITGPGIKCYSPGQHRLYAHDGQVFNGVPSGSVGAKINQILSNWAARKIGNPPGTPVFRIGC